MEHKNINTPDFHQEWEIEFNNQKNNIEEAIKDKKELTINIVNSPLKDSIGLKRDPNYVPDDLLIINGSTISTKYITEEFKDFILNTLSEEIEVLNVPGEFLQNVDQLALFPKLREVRITNFYELSKEEMLKIKNNTTINKIEIINIKNLYNDYDENAVYYDGKYRDITFTDKDFNVVNYTSGKNVIANNFIVNNLYRNIDDVINYIKENNMDISELEFFNIITAIGNEDYICYNSTENEMEYYGDINQLRNIVEKLSLINIKPNKIYLKLENKDYDFSSLRGLKYPIEIDYGVINTATIEEFIAMRETINYYKELITQYNLSPIEQVTYAYDIIKSFEYKEAEDKGDSRSPHEYIVGGKIVCVGYSIFLEQVLKELGFKIEYLSVNTLENNNEFSSKESNHARNIIRIDDDKYNIHMIAALDATWDSDTRSNTQYRFLDEENFQKRFVETNNLLSYIYFLIPKNDYEYTFEDKDLPALFSYPTKMFVKNFDMKPKINRPITSFDVGLSTLQCLFEKEEINSIERYIDAPRPSYDTFKEIIRNVKLAEGYTYKETEDVINDIKTEDVSLKRTR